MLFLIEYDRKAGSLVGLFAFNDVDREQASKSRLALEIKRMNEGVKSEVVLLEAVSEEALRATHNRYFWDVHKLAKAGEDVVSVRLPSDVPNALRSSGKSKRGGKAK